MDNAKVTPMSEDVWTTLASGLHAYEMVFGQDAYSPMWDAVARARAWLDSQRPAADETEHTTEAEAE